MKKDQTAGLMKIGELAKATNTNVSTIKFYVKEGLIQAACKTGPNMAYYHTDSIARVDLIRSLQKEHYYPLSVIKRMLDQSDPNKVEMELLDVIHKVNYIGSSKTFSLSETAKMTRLTREQIAALAETGLVKPESAGKKQYFTDSDLQIMLLLRRRMDAAIPFEESVSSFLLYEESLRSAAKADVDFFISRALMAGVPSTKDAVRMIEVSDETLDAFICMKRAELNREFGSKRINDLYHYSENLSAMLQEMAFVLDQMGYSDLAGQCRNALAEGPNGDDSLTAAFMQYYRVVNGLQESLARSITICSRAHSYFLSLTPEKTGGIGELLLYGLRLCWLCLAPSLLDCTSEAKLAMEGFQAFASGCLGTEAEVFTHHITAAVNRIGGYHEY